MTDKRVFHIDRECYVVFIGATKQDLRPFIRIGNSPRIPSEVTDEIRDVIITDRLTGSPVHESRTVEQSIGSDLRYLGDPDMVARFKTFVGHEDLPTEQFETTTREEKPKAEQSFVYFYRDGGMSVYVGQDKIFSLAELEKRDRHYIELTRRIKSELLKDPLRIQKSDLQGTGFLRCGEICMFFRDGQIGATPLTPDSFYALASKGIDPDLVSIWNVDDTGEELVRLFKRTRLKRSSVTVLHPHPEEIAPLARLFESSGDGPAAHIVTVGPDADIKRSGLQYALTADARGIRITGDLFVESAVIGSDTETGVSVLAHGTSRPVLRSSDEKSVGLELLDAVPYTVAADDEPSDRTVSARYLSSWTPFVRAHVDSATMLAVEQIDQLFARPPQGRARDQLVKSIEQRVKNIETPSRGPLAVYLHNAAVAVEGRVRRGGHDGGRPMQSLANSLSRFAYAINEDDVAAAPCRADLYWTPATRTVFFKPASPTMSVRNVEHSREVRGSLSALAADDPELYERERKELLDLLRLLRKGGMQTPAGSAGTPEAKTASTSDAQSSDASRRKDESGKTPGSDQNAKRSGAGTAGRSSENTSADSRTPSSLSSGPTITNTSASGRADASRRKKTIGIAALVLLLLGAVFLLSPDLRSRVQDSFGRVVSGPDDLPAEGVDTDPNADAPVEDADVVADADADADADPATPDTDIDPVESPSGEISDTDTTVELDGNGMNLSFGSPSGVSIDPALDAAGIYTDLAISIADLIRITNRIAVASGFREMGDPPTEGPDPDLVLPDTVLVLPDSRTYQVVSGDYIWFLAARSIRDDIRTILNRYEALMDNVVLSDLQSSDRENLAGQLDDMAVQALSSAFAARIRAAAAIVRQEND